MLIYILISSRLKQVAIFSRFFWPSNQSQIRLLKLGLPVALALFFEITLFAVVALLVAPLGSITVAAHQVAINFSSMVFMLPMSIGVAVSIRVGQKLGEENIEGAKIASHVAIIVGIVSAITTGIATILFREPITQLYTSNPEVIAISVQLLLIAAIYQITDAFQVIAGGALRGYKDMKAIFLCTFIAYWILGLPTGYALGLTDWIISRIGVYGFWVGFIVGLSSAAVMLGFRLRWMHRQDDQTQLEFASR